MEVALIHRTGGLAKWEIPIIKLSLQTLYNYSSILEHPQNCPAMIRRLFDIGDYQPEVKWELLLRGGADVR